MGHKEAWHIRSLLRYGLDHIGFDAGTANGNHADVILGGQRRSCRRRNSARRISIPTRSCGIGADASRIDLHRLDGNLTNDLVWSYTWDGENRLLSVETLGTVANAARSKVSWDYDAAGRRVRQTVSTNWNGSDYSSTIAALYLYDGWACVAELSSTGTFQRQYAWGLDLSGTPTGAGGVGGLLWMRPSDGAAHFAAFDGNGNVVGLIDGSTGTVSARYDYDVFGQTIRLTGAMARDNAFRFSTKRTDPTTGLVLYEYRAYSPSMGRWPNRDPIGERGGLSVAAFVANCPISFYDVGGLAPSGALPPTGGIEAGAGRWNLSYDAFVRYLEDIILKRPLLPGEQREVALGCVGQCTVIQRDKTGSPVLSRPPETAENTKCFHTEVEAVASKCPNNKEAFVFAKQGRRWNVGGPSGPPGYAAPPGEPAAPGKEAGEIPTNSVYPNGSGVFNYIARCSIRGQNGGNQTIYTWMNFAVGQGPTPDAPSEGRVSTSPYPGDNTYRVTMWCRTCPK